MSDEYEVEVEVPEPAEASSSLAARMQQRSAELEKQTSEKFPIPGYEGILEVELRALGYKTIRRVQKRNERVRDEGLREIYTMADQLLMATVGFHEVLPDGTNKSISDDWISLAKRLPNCPEAPSPRQALLFVVTDKRIAFLIQEWGEWSKSVRSDLDEEVVQDFVTTG